MLSAAEYRQHHSVCACCCCCTGLVWNVSLTRGHSKIVPCTSTRPRLVCVLKLKTDEAKVAATGAKHVLAVVHMIDEFSTFGTRPGIRTPGHRCYRLQSAMLQLFQLRRRPVALVVSAALEARPPWLSTVPAEKHDVSFLTTALVASHFATIVIPSLREVAPLVGAALAALTNLRLAPDVVLVDDVERLLEFFVAHHRRQDVSDNDPRHRSAARRTLELVSAVL